MIWDRPWRAAEVEPSLYASDLSRLADQLDLVLGAGAQIVHFDVGDGQFVEEITLGAIVLRSISEQARRAGAALDCHLMVSRPARQLKQFRAAGADSVTFHVEAEGDPLSTLALARELGMGVGVALNPDTPLKRALAVGEQADLVLCMAIHPGLSGRKLMPQTFERLGSLREALPDHVRIQVDGGVHQGNIGALREAGADLLVCGSAIFWATDPATAYRALATTATAIEAKPEPSAISEERR
jgi:ribulose-phosphate 3-epimerase